MGRFWPAFQGIDDSNGGLGSAVRAAIDRFARLIIDAPAGDVYFGAENPKGELGFYIHSKGGGVPYRMKIRAPSFANLSIIPSLLPGHYVSDVPAILGSIDFVMGECDR